MTRVFGVFLVAVATLAVAAADKDDPAKDELKKFEGTWEMVSGEKDGEKAPADAIKGMKVTFKDGKVTKLKGDDVITEGPFTIDPTKKPKTIDISETGKKVLGIYELDGDNLKLCFTIDGKERPKELSAKKDSGCAIMVFKRVK